MDRDTETLTTRGWSCGTGHTTFNRVAHDATTGKYALLCSTDYNEAGIGGLGAYVFRMEDGPAQEFDTLNLDVIKGGASSSRHGRRRLSGRPRGSPRRNPRRLSGDPGTSIGLARWDASGVSQGPIQWIVEDPEAFLSYSTLVPIARNRFSCWGACKGSAKTRTPTERSSPNTLVLLGHGNRRFRRALTKPQAVEGAGWGELDEMVPLGQGRAGVHRRTRAQQLSRTPCVQPTHTSAQRLHLVLGG